MVIPCFFKKKKENKNKNKKSTKFERNHDSFVVFYH